MTDKVDDKSDDRRSSNNDVLGTILSELKDIKNDIRTIPWRVKMLERIVYPAIGVICVYFLVSINPWTGKTKAETKQITSIEEKTIVQ